MMVAECGGTRQCHVERKPYNRCSGAIAACFVTVLAFGCSGASTSSDGTGAANGGGTVGVGGNVGSGGSGLSGSSAASGSTPASGGAANSSGKDGGGGRPSASGGANQGSLIQGGAQSEGGVSFGGKTANAGGNASGGKAGQGTTASGGNLSAGGNAAGGVRPAGGATASGGQVSAGGAPAAGGRTAVTYTAAWTSVDKHTAAPEWFQDAKFGLWHHFGAFCLPAFGSEWYPRNMFNVGSSEYNHHVSVYGDPRSNWPYQNFLDGANNKAGVFVQFAPKLKSAGGKFDPDEWAQLFADAGAKMAGPVAEHHDGFSMWKSAANEWNSVAKGPKLDLVDLFAKAYRAKGMKFMVSTHTAYNFGGYYQWVPAQTDASLKKLYGQLAKADESKLWIDKEKELIDLYQPDYMWHDFGMNNVTEAHRLEYLAYYYNKEAEWGKEVVVSYNDGFNNKGEIHQVERGGEVAIANPFWLSEDTVSLTTWGYTEGMRYYTAKALIHALIDRVSKNGFLLLNTSPMADGTFPQAQKDILLAIGNWLKVFGESIYATRAWTKFGEGPTVMGGGGMGAPAEGKAADIRFTRSKDSKVLYAIGMGWPTNNQMVITSLKTGSFNTSTISSVSFVSGDSCTWTQDSTGLKVNLPSNQSNGSGYAVKISFSGTIPQPS